MGIRNLNFYYLNSLLRDNMENTCNVCSAPRFRLLGKRCALCSSRLCKDCVDTLPPNNVKLCPLCSICHAITPAARLEVAQSKSVVQLKWISNKLKIDISNILEKRELIQCITKHFEPVNDKEEQTHPQNPLPDPYHPVEDIPYSESTVESKISEMTMSESECKEDKSKLEEIIAELSTKQLKAILQNHHINTRTFFEKSELQEAVMQFCRSQSRDKLIELFPKYSEKIESAEDLYDKKPAYDACMCSICMENPANCVLLECGHIGVCLVCSKHLVDCPFCRRKITRVVQTFYA